ncbi:MAG: AAA family ATPase, partial [Deltaproteobacteria bacterium]|nr:AAA family ATPase [Deltaproteobacteria bacterium]
SLGILCFRALTGRFPFEAKTLDDVMNWHRKGGLTAETWGKADVPRYLRDMVEKMLEKNPADRFSTAGVAIRFLNRTAGNRYQKAEAEIGARLPMEGPLVGREKILEQIKKQLEKPADFSPVFLVRGERGSGKHRLLSEAKRLAELTEGVCLSIECDRLKPAWEELAHGLGLPEVSSDNPDETWQTKVRVDTLVSTAKQKPLFLFINNFDRADRPLQLVTQALKNARAPLFMMLAEEGEGGDVPLLRLTEAEIQRYVELVLGPIDRLESTATLLHQYSAGLPLLVSEGLKFMAPHIFRGEPLQKLLPPPGIGFLYQEKIARLSDASRQILEWLALLFRPASIEELIAIGGTPEIVSLIEPCLRCGMVERAGKSYQVAGQALSLDLIHRMEASHKKALHLQIASGLEKAGEAPLRELGYHWATGGETEKGRNYYKKTAKEFQEKGNITEAAHYLAKAIPLAARDSAEHQELAGEGVRCLTLAGNYEQASTFLLELKEKSYARESLAGFLAFKQRHLKPAAEAYQKAFSLLPPDDLREKIQCENALGNIALQSGDMAEAEKWFRQTLHEEEGLASEERKKISNNALGIVLGRQGKTDEAVEFYKKRLSLLSPDQISQEISLLSGEGYVLIEGSRFVEARAALTRARDLAKKSGEVHALFSILGNLITALHKESRYTEALSVLDEMISLQMRLGSQRDLANNLLRQGDIYHVLGMEEPARACFKKGREIAGKMGDKNLAGWFDLMESYCERQYGTHSKAEQMLQVARKQGEEGKDPALALWAQYGLGDLALQMGKSNEARKILASLSAEGMDAEFKVRLHLLAAWLTPLDQIKDVGTQFAAMEEVCQKNHYPELLWEIYHAWGKMEFAAGQRQKAQAILGKGAAILREIASALPEEYRDRYLKQPERYRLITDFRKISGTTVPQKSVASAASKSLPPVENLGKTLVTPQKS